MVIYNYFLVWN